MSHRHSNVALALVLAIVCSRDARADEIGVSSAEEIATVLKTAKPGDVLVMKDGEWKDQAIKFVAKGTEEEPIEMRAQTPGGVKLLGNSSITFQGEWLVASGLLFGDSDSTESAVAFEGSDCRFTDSAIVAKNRGGKWVHFRKGQRNRIDHCYLEGHAPQDVTLQVEIDEKVPNEARIDHNHFGPRPPLGKNGGETIRVGYSGQQTRVSKTLVEHNLFDRCDGEIEIISSKCTGSTYRYNTFRDCEGTLTLRHGGHCTVEGNYFLGRSDGKSGGIRVIGAGHTIVNNYFENVGPTAGGVIALTSGMREPKPTDYQHVNGALVAFNTIVNCGLPYVKLDAGFAPERTRDILPKDVTVANNLFVAGKTDAKATARTLVDGQEGSGFTWTGNIAFGADAGDAGSAAKGIKTVDPKLAPGQDGVMRAAADSPVRGAAAGDAKVEHDIDGQPRGGKKDVGADQVSDEKAKNKPLKPDDVGPSWMKPPRGEQSASGAQTVSRLSFALKDEALVVKNDHLSAALVNGQLVITPARGEGKITATLSDEVTKGREPTVGSTNIEDVEAIEVRGDGAVQHIWAPKDQPFIYTRVQLQNAGSEPLKLKQLSALKLNVKLPNAGNPKLFGSDGPAPLPEGKASYVFLALADATTRGGVVSGWLTHEKGSGIVDASKPGAAWDARSEFGTLTIAPNSTETSETFAIGFFADIRDGLEAFGDATAKANRIKLVPVLNGYSTWYHARALDQERMAKLAKFAKDNRLDEYGLNVLQIDDQWQVHRRDFTTHKTGDKATYADGMKKTADTIKANGFGAGLWITPFGWQGREFQDDKPHENRTVLKDKPDWFVRTTEGKVYWVRWAGDCLDMSNPAAREFLKAVIQRMTSEWGYTLLKIDGLWAGMAVKILYPSPKYRDDGLGDAVFYDKAKTNIEVYRDGLRLVREAAGTDTFLLGCNIAQNMRTMGASIGLVDAMRVGPDIGATWDKVVRCAIPATWLYFWNGRAWWNDPDCLMLRDPLTIENGRAWASWIAISGQMNLVSEWLPELPPERLDIYLRTIPNHHLLTARPVDLLDGKLARVWHLHYGEGDDRRDVVALFNWNAAEKGDGQSTAGAVQEEPTASEAAKVGVGAAKVMLDLAQLGLPTDQTYAAFDFWEDQFLDPITGTAEFDLQPGSCKVIALKRRSDRPQVVSTNRHVSQGAVDLSDVKWDAATQTLSGWSKVVGGEDYELRIDPGDALPAPMVTVGGAASASSKLDGRHVRVTIESATSGDVAWSVRFAPESARAK